MTKKVLIVGGCGFIGHNLGIFLKKKKFDVTIFDSLSVNNYFSFKKDNNCLFSLVIKKNSFIK
jgi:nucleoside-diphosphate-sugar epimerase